VLFIFLDSRNRLGQPHAETAESLVLGTRSVVSQVRLVKLGSIVELLEEDIANTDIPIPTEVG
jgi:hypothetical protein